jgi:hypothetical protein
VTVEVEEFIRYVQFTGMPHPLNEGKRKRDEWRRNEWRREEWRREEWRRNEWRKEEWRRNWRRYQ